MSADYFTFRTNADGHFSIKCGNHICDCFVTRDGDDFLISMNNKPFQVKTRPFVDNDDPKKKDFRKKDFRKKKVPQKSQEQTEASETISESADLGQTKSKGPRDRFKGKRPYPKRKQEKKEDAKPEESKEDFKEKKDEEKSNEKKEEF